MIDTVATLWSMAIGGMGGVIWWALPPQPNNSRAIVLRIAVGVVVGFIANALSSVSPFDASGNWNPTGIGELLTLGFGGLASLSGVLPDKYAKHINESVTTALKAAGGSDNTNPPSPQPDAKAPLTFEVDVISENEEEALDMLEEKLRNGSEYVLTVKHGNREKIILRKPKKP